MRETIMTAAGAAPARTLDMVTEEIRYLDTQAKRLMLGHAIEIGRRLVEAKALVPHGGWGDYIRERLDYSQSTANNFMRIFEEYGAAQQSLFGPVANSQTLGNLSYTKALKLLAVPEEEREAFAVEVDAEHLSSRELDAAIRERDEAKKKLEEIQSGMEGTALRIAELEEQRDAARQAAASADSAAKEREKAFRQELEEAEKELEALRSRPVEIAIQRDEAAIEEAVKAEKQRAAQELAAAKKTAKDAAEAARKTETELKDRVADLQAKLKKAKDAAMEAPERERQLSETRAELEAVRKQLAMSGAEMAAAKVHFAAWQEAYDRLRAAVDKVPEEAAERLRAAIRAQARAWAGVNAEEAFEDASK